MLKLLAFLFAAGKLGKVAITGGTMLISVFAYALVFGWWYAVGFVALIFIHEMGHFVAARLRGLDVGAPTFIPFVSNLMLALSYAGFFINLFNLIPLSPFDGGRITAIISPRLWLAGVPILVALFFWSPSPMLILVAILAAPQVMKALKYDASAPENAEYYKVSLEHKFTYGALYLALAAYLAVMSHDVHEMLSRTYKTSVSF